MKNSLRVARAEVRMTQQQLADAVGVSRQTINAIESGKFVPSTVLALKIAAVPGTPFGACSHVGEGDSPAPRPRRNHRFPVPAPRNPAPKRPETRTSNQSANRSSNQSGNRPASPAPSGEDDPTPHPRRRYPASSGEDDPTTHPRRVGPD